MARSSKSPHEARDSVMRSGSEDEGAASALDEETASIRDENASSSEDGSNPSDDEECQSVPDSSSSEGEEDTGTAVEAEQLTVETGEPATEWMSCDRKIVWFSTSKETLSYNPVPTGTTPGPTRYAAAHISSLKSAFDLFITGEMVQLLCKHTNLRGKHKCDKWVDVDEVEMRAYIGILILAGVYRSRHEVTRSMWDEKMGRAIFRATMPLSRYTQISANIRFHDKLARPGRYRGDGLAGFRTLWEMWVARLPLMFHPGVDVCVDEQLVAFKGRCKFRQYVPRKPTKYGIKIWVICDVATSYAWGMQIYTGKPKETSQEVNRGMRVILDLTEGLRGHTVTCDTFFTSFALAEELLRRKLALVGAIKRTKPELPPQLLTARQRHILSSVFAFTKTTMAVCYVPKRGKNMLLLSTKHREPAVSSREQKQPAVILDYNKCKGSVDNLDKVVRTYSCRRKTNRWQLVLFHNLLDVSAYNAFVLWRSVHPEWESTKSHGRRVFLEELGSTLVTPAIERRTHLPRSTAAAAVVARTQHAEKELEPLSPNTVRRRCELCTRRRRTTATCSLCGRSVCKDHSKVVCTSCRL